MPLYGWILYGFLLLLYVPSLTAHEAQRHSGDVDGVCTVSFGGTHKALESRHGPVVEKKLSHGPVELAGHQEPYEEGPDKTRGRNIQHVL